ncbi:MAG: general secretion pathway protein GspK [Nitrospirae bacterium]|nr:general secretion pathway protein GspK [Nitrospirota bacterium]
MAPLKANTTLPGRGNDCGSAVLLAIFISAIVITVSVGFNWLVKEHIKSASALKAKSEALVSAHSAYGTLIYAILTGQLQSNRIILSDKLIAGITEVPINNSAVQLTDDVAITVQDSNGRIPVADGVGAEMGNLVNVLADSGNAGTSPNPSIVVDSINDWIDRDDSPRLNGAESGYYLSFGFKYRPRNSQLLYLRELTLVRGIDEDLYEKLSQYITILPTTGFNPNTASATVVRAYLALSKDKADALKGKFRIEPITSLDSFNQMAGTSLTPSMDTSYFVPSSYFDVTVSYFSGGCSYVISSGIGLQESATTPYSTYYWKEG